MRSEGKWRPAALIVIIALLMAWSATVTLAADADTDEGRSWNPLAWMDTLIERAHGLQGRLAFLIGDAETRASGRGTKDLAPRESRGKIGAGGEIIGAASPPPFEEGEHQVPNDPSLPGG